jgi:glycosyltransferase involved in cell wall biosynthesis
VNVIYVSYDGLLDPLGASQVEPYVRGLAERGHRFVLISFEKPETTVDREQVSTLSEPLAAAGVDWWPLRYHRSPRLAATALDVWNGRRAIRDAIHRTAAELVHCRGDVAMTMARSASRRVPLLYDMRGFFADERCESGSWRRGGMIDRVVRRAEARNLAAANALVVLTEVALRVLRERGTALPPARVIPTSVDVERFVPSEGGEPEFGLGYVGSLGTWYLAREMVSLARESVAQGFGPPLFVTNQPSAATTAGASADWARVVCAQHAEVPHWLRRCRAAFFLIRPSPAKRASCPTKLGEALACGLPVLANAGIGDVDEILESARVGVTIREFTRDAYEAGLRRLLDLTRETGIRERCRGVAERRFALARAVDSYGTLYREALLPSAQ